jgi:hypothetical protein
MDSYVPTFVLKASISCCANIRELELMVRRTEIEKFNLIRIKVWSERMINRYIVKTRIHYSLSSRQLCPWLKVAGTLNQAVEQSLEFCLARAFQELKIGISCEL